MIGYFQTFDDDFTEELSDKLEDSIFTLLDNIDIVSFTPGYTSSGEKFYSISYIFDGQLRTVKCMLLHHPDFNTTLCYLE